MTGRAASVRDHSKATPLEVARTAVDRGRHLGVAVEVFVEFGRTVNVKTYGGEVESITVAEPHGVGVRAVREGRIGYAFTADLGPAGLDSVLGEAAAAAGATDPDPYVELPYPPVDPYPQIEGLWRAEVASTSVEDKIGLALRAESAALAAKDISAVEESVYADLETRVAVASSTGLAAEAEQTFCYLYVVAHAGRDGDIQSGLGLTSGRGPSALEPETAGEEAADKARVLLGASPCPTGSYGVVFDREVVAALLWSMVPALSAEAVQKGRSLFSGKLGEAVASSTLTVIDDGLAPDGMATSPFDGEGVTQQSTVLLEGGVLRSYLHSSYTARKAGGDTRSTGNAGRGSYRTLPAVRGTNLVIPNGEGSLPELVARVGEGLYIEGVTGLHSGVNAISGEVSVGITGRLISGGELTRPVREVTVAADFFQLLGSITGIAGDARWTPLYGSAFVPSLAVRDLAVSGV